MSVLDRMIQRLTEAMGPIPYPVDQDENLYRRLTESPRNLQPVEQARMIEYAAYLFNRNPLARRLIEIQSDYVVGEGLIVSSDDPQIDKVIKRHWFDTTNNWPLKAEQRFKDLRLFGEACWPVAISPGTGNVVLGVVDPGRIRAVVRDPIQIDEADVVILNSYVSGGQEVYYKVIREDPETGTLEGIDPRAQDIAVSLPGAVTMTIRPGDFSGQCFYFAINKVATASRGVSDLFSLIDYIDGADQHLWTLLERAKLVNAMVFDVSVEGAPQDVQREEERIRAKKPTRPGTVNVHSANVTWEMLQANFGAQENEVVLEALLRWVVGGVGLPESYFGKGSDTNRATIEGQADPVIKRFTAIQRQWIEVINTVLRFQIETGQKKGARLTEAIDTTKPKTAPGNSQKLKIDPTKPLPWKITQPDMATKDVGRLSSAVSQITVALAEAEQQEYVSKDTARRSWLTIMKGVGVETDPEEEAKKIEGEKKQAQDDAASMGYHVPPEGAIPGADGQDAANMQRQDAERQAKASQLGESEVEVTAAPPTPGGMIALYPHQDDASRHALMGGEDPDQLHVTLCVFPDGTIEDLFSKIANVVREMAQSTPPLSGTVSGTGRFDLPDREGITYASIDVPGLVDFRQSLVSKLEAQGARIDRTHDFVPHITLARGDQAHRDVVSGPITFPSLSFVYGDRRYEVPFSTPTEVEGEEYQVTESTDGLIVLERADQPGGLRRLTNTLLQPLQDAAAAKDQEIQELKARPVVVNVRLPEEREQPTPVVNVDVQVPEQREQPTPVVNVTVDAPEQAPAPIVHVHVPEQALPAPQVTVVNEAVPQPTKITKTITELDEHGEPKIIEEKREY